MRHIFASALLMLTSCMGATTSLPPGVEIENVVAACIEYRLTGTFTKTESEGRIIYVPAAGPIVSATLEEISIMVTQLCPNS